MGIINGIDGIVEINKDVNHDARVKVSLGVSVTAVQSAGFLPNKTTSNRQKSTQDKLENDDRNDERTRISFRECSDIEW